MWRAHLPLIVRCKGSMEWSVLPWQIQMGKGLSLATGRGNDVYVGL